MRRIAGEPGQLQIDQAQRHLRRADVDPEHQRPPRGDRGEAFLRRPVDASPGARRRRRRAAAAWRRSSNAPIPWAIAQCSSASASASLSSAGAKPSLADSVDHRLLVGVALAGDVPLDRADGDALVRDAVGLGPGGEMREVTAERMRRAGAQMPTHFFEHDDTDTARRFVDLLQPAHGSAARSCRRRRTGRGGTPGRRWRSHRRDCERPSRFVRPRSRARITGGVGLPPASTSIGTGAATLAFGCRCVRSHRSHGSLHRVVVVRAVASPAKAVATVRLAFAVVIIGTHRSSPITGCRSAHRLQAASRSLMHARSAGS